MKLIKFAPFGVLYLNRRADAPIWAMYRLGLRLSSPIYKIWHAWVSRVSAMLSLPYANVSYKFTKAVYSGLVLWRGQCWPGMNVAAGIDFTLQVELQNYLKLPLASAFFRYRQWFSSALCCTCTCCNLATV